MFRFLILLLIFLGSNSSALAANLFDPNPDSKAIYILSSIFGGLMPNGGGDPMLAGIAKFNLAMVVLGGLLFSWTTISSVINTAHDGEMLGKKFSSAWIPIRYSVATGLLLPVVGGGYCVAQAIVMWIVIQGVGLADQVWTTSMQGENLAQFVSASSARPEASQLATKLFESMMCENVLNYAKTITYADILGFKQMDVGVTTTTGALGTTLSFGVRNGVNGLRTDQCGSVKVDAFTIPAIPTSSGPFNGVVLGQESVERMKALNQLSAAQLNVMISQVDTFAARQVKLIMDDKPMESLDALKGFSNTYEEALKNQAASLILEMSNNNELSKAASRDGFITAGSFYTKLIAVNDLVTRTVAAVPEATGPTAVKIDSLNDVYGKVFMRIQKSYSDSGSSNIVSFGVGMQQGGSEMSSWESIKETVMSGFDPRILAKKAFTSFGSYLFNVYENMAMASQRLGNWTLGAGSFAAGGLMIANATVGLTPGIAQDISNIIQLCVTPLMLVGFVLSYVVPNIPAFIFYGSVAGWGVAVIIAILAAPLWIACHLSPEGHDIAGKGTPGYMLVLSLLMRPVLMIFGMMAGIVLTSVVGGFINRIFADTFIMSQSDSGFLILVVGQFIAAPVLYACFSIILMKKFFSLIHDLPDNLLKWIGGSESFGHFGSDAGSDHSFAAVGMTSKTIGSAVSGEGANGGGGGGSGGHRSLTDRHKEMMDGQKQGITQKARSEAGPGASNEAQSFSQKLSENQMNDSIETLGGEDSDAAESFVERVNKLKEEKPGVPLSQHMKNALHREINHMYGSGVASTSARMAGGYTGDSFRDAVGMFKDKMGELDQKGMSQPAIHKAFTDVAANAKSSRDEHVTEAKAKGEQPTISLKDFVQQGLDNIRVKGED